MKKIQEEFGVILKNRRAELGMTLKQVALKCGLDASLLSKFEFGSRLANYSHLGALSKGYQLEEAYLKKLLIIEKLAYVLQDADDPLDLYLLAEPRVEYLSKAKALERIQLTDDVEVKLAKLDALKARWQEKHPLSDIHLQKIREYFDVAYTYESNKIEGNTLTLRETDLVVNEGLTISGKSMVEHLEAINHSEAIEFIHDLVAEGVSLDKRTLLQIHGLILRGVNREYAGRYRDVPVMIRGSEHEPPQPYMVDKMMEEYFIHFENHKEVLHPVILAAEMHERLVTIHPFIDGNGRTSRLVMNLILLANGYTIANLKGDNQSRIKYFDALEKVQTENEPQHFYDLIIEAVESSLQKHIALAG